MLVIPLAPTPSQHVTTILGSQYVQIDVFQKRTGLFANVYLDNVLVIGGVICQDRNRLVRSEYLGFAGDLAFIDTRGSDDPTYDGLGDRFKLLYLEPADLK